MDRFWGDAEEMSMEMLTDVDDVDVDEEVNTAFLSSSACSDLGVYETDDTPDPNPLKYPYPQNPVL